MNRREAILERLNVVLATVGTTFRNRQDVPEASRPAVVIQDQAEEGFQADNAIGRQLRSVPSIVEMKPRIVVLSNVSINALRVAAIRAIMGDAELSALCLDGGIMYRGFDTRFARGRSLEGEADLKFLFRYVELPRFPVIEIPSSPDFAESSSNEALSSSQTEAASSSTPEIPSSSPFEAASSSNHSDEYLSSDRLLSDANLSDRGLSDRNLSDAQASDRALSDRNLSDRLLSDRQLSDAQLSDAQLSDRNLSDRQLSDRQLSDRQLSDRQLSDRQLSDRMLSDRNLSDKILHDAASSSDRLLSDRNLSDRNLSDRNLSDRMLSDRNLSDKIIHDAQSSSDHAHSGQDPGASSSDMGTFVSFVNTGTAVSTNATSNISPGLPANRVAGNVLISYINGTGSKTFTASAGWTKFDNVANTACAWRIATNTAADALTWSWSGGGAFDAIIHQYTGNDTVAPIGATASANGNGNLSTSVTTTRNKSLVIGFDGITSAGATITTGLSGWTVESRITNATIPSMVVYDKPIDAIQNVPFSTNNLGGSTANTIHAIEIKRST